MSTAIASANINVIISAWSDSNVKLPNGKDYYAVQATMALQGSSSVVKITNGGTNIIVDAEQGVPVQLNFSATLASDLKLPTGGTKVLVSTPYYKTLADQTTTAWSQFATVLVNHAGDLSTAMTWAYKGTTYSLASIPSGGLAVIDLNNYPGTYSFGFILQDNTAALGLWDPDVVSDPVEA
jgi:hypothetical protein